MPVVRVRTREGVEVVIDTDEIFQAANETVQVEAAVLKRATDIANRARRLDAAENGGTADITLDRRVMPNGRLVYHVQSTDADGEHGTSSTARRRTLRRAVGSK
ncbi:hypothetical protein [Gordonia soli]|uniref:Uncharacterized protein n=1 Tax=Gordonia soli NBRC 108243 TaxID=1223545 RepID=M0QRE2_9ACTN|nr:hypothetical protein [Gordonia soli]GAC71029.1 hypothetical protein GS4_47_00190 [Gordonia soli NBRC 108243]